MIEVPFERLKGKTLVSIGGDKDTDITFTTSNGEQFLMTHEQECCEKVYLAEIIGDLNCLLNRPLLMAEKITNAPFTHATIKTDESLDWEEWTFYKLATSKGYVTLRWYGVSNGYYSTGVSFYRSK